MSNSIITLGEARRREEAARRRGERYAVSPEVREARAAMLAEREAIQAGQEAAAKAKREASPDALHAILARGTVEELSEVARMIGRLDGRRLQAIVDDVFRAKTRTAYVPAPIAVSEPVSESQVADVPAQAPGSPVQTRGRSKATPAA